VGSNGQLAASELVLIPNNEDITTYGAQYIAAPALPYLLAAAREFREQAGQRLYVKEAYRPLSTQVAYFVARYFVAIVGVFWNGRRWLKRLGAATAAVPGTSIHGVGWALDIWSGVDTSFKSRNHLIWVAVAARYGWKNTGTAFGEPWHQEWSASRVTAYVAPVSAHHPTTIGGALTETRVAALITFEEDDMGFKPLIAKTQIGDGPGTDTWVFDRNTKTYDHVRSNTEVALLAKQGAIVLDGPQPKALFRGYRYTDVDGKGIR
jgi:hypothetical protein